MSSSARKSLRTSRLVVLKIGSSLLTGADGLNHQNMRQICKQVSEIHRAGRSVVIVSSGAIVEGSHRLKFLERPSAVQHLQAAAAVGQIGLVTEYQKYLASEEIHTALVLLTHDDLKDRLRYLNARNTIRSLLDYQVIPVVNENDTVSTKEIQFGDNDTLAARVASLVQADLLVVLTDQLGFFEVDPRRDPSAKLISETYAHDKTLDEMATGGTNELGRGGMQSKLQAARFAADAGCHTVIANGFDSSVLQDVLSGQNVGSLLTARLKPTVARKQWIAGQLNVDGTLVVDSGAVKALQQRGRSLLAAGVAGVDGDFRRGSLVQVLSEDGQKIAQGLTNYNSSEIATIKGSFSEQIETLLGYAKEPEIIHRDNLAVLAI